MKYVQARVPTSGAVWVSWEHLHVLFLFSWPIQLKGDEKQPSGQYFLSISNTSMVLYYLDPSSCNQFCTNVGKWVKRI